MEGEGAEPNNRLPHGPKLPMSDSSVQKLYEKLKAVFLDKILVALGPADGAPTMQNGWRACEIWDEGEETCSRGSETLQGEKRKLYAEVAQSIEGRIKERKALARAVGGGIRIVKHRKAPKRSNQLHVVWCVRERLVVVWRLAVVDLPLHTKEGRDRAFGVVRSDIGRRSARFYTAMGKDKVWVCAALAIGLPYPCCLCSECLIAYLLNSVCGCLVV